MTQLWPCQHRRFQEPGFRDWSDFAKCLGTANWGRHDLMWESNVCDGDRNFTRKVWSKDLFGRAQCWCFQYDFQHSFKSKSRLAQVMLPQTSVEMNDLWSLWFAAYRSHQLLPKVRRWQRRRHCSSLEAGMMNLDHRSMISHDKSNIFNKHGDFCLGWTIGIWTRSIYIPWISSNRTRRVRKGRNTMATWPMEEWETKWSQGKAR